MPAAIERKLARINRQEKQSSHSVDIALVNNSSN